MAAAGMKMIVSACNRGDLAACSCIGRTHCKDIGVLYGYHFSKSFIDVQEYEKVSTVPMTSDSYNSKQRRSMKSLSKSERREIEQKLLNLYNNEVGRVVSIKKFNTHVRNWSETICADWN